MKEPPNWISVGQFVYNTRLYLGFSRKDIIERVNNYLAQHDYYQRTEAALRRLETGDGGIREHTIFFEALEVALGLLKGTLENILVGNTATSIDELDALLTKLRDINNMLYTLGRQGHLGSIQPLILGQLGLIDAWKRLHIMDYKGYSVSDIAEKTINFTATLAFEKTCLDVMLIAAVLSTTPRSKLTHYQVQEYLVTLQEAITLFEANKHREHARYYLELAMVLRPTVYYTYGSFDQALRGYLAIQSQLSHRRLNAMCQRDKLICTAKLRRWPLYDDFVAQLDASMASYDDHLRAKLIEGRARALHLFGDTRKANVMLKPVIEFYGDILQDPTDAAQIQFLRSFVCIQAAGEQSDTEQLMAVAPYVHGVLEQRGMERYQLQVEDALRATSHADLQQLGGQLAWDRLGNDKDEKVI